MTRPMEWQPIASAPKDGARVLVVYRRRMRAVAEYHPQWGWRTVPGKYGIDPTHWQPLPPAPEAT